MDLAVDLAVNSKVYIVVRPNHPMDEPFEVLNKEELDEAIERHILSDKSDIFEVLVKRKYIVNTKLVLNLVK